MSASDPEEQFYTQFDKLYCKVFSHGLTANSPQGRFKDKLYFYLKERCAEVDDWRINEPFGYDRTDNASGGANTDEDGNIYNDSPNNEIISPLKI